MATKTPQKDKSSQGLPIPGFSPVPISPGKSPLQGNLTGTPRKVKDTCADWFNCVQKWQALNTKGFNIASEIANIKLSSVLSTEEGNKVTMPTEMAPLCEKLGEVYNSLEKIYNKMVSLTVTLQGVYNLEVHQSVDLEPMFHTWTVDRFADTSKQLSDMYKKELEVKNIIVENIAHATDRNLMMFHTAAWLHEGYITEDSTFMLESMLKECGLK